MQEKEFIELLNKHQNIVHKICNVYMDEQPDKEDLFQEIILQAWKAIQTFRSESLFSTWLYRVALNTAITFFKKQKKSLSTAKDFIPDVTEQYDPIEEQVAAMYKAIGCLSKIDKAIVMLYLEDYSYKEIAEVIGISVTNVGVKMNRIKSKLKEETSKHYHPIN